MRFVKRLTVWALEIGCVIPLLAIAVNMIMPCDFGFSGCLSDGVMTVSFGFLITGFLLTTAVARAFWPRHKVMLYPVGAAILYFCHSQLFFMVADVKNSQALGVILSGACIVAVCTLAGSLVLRRWDAAPSAVPKPAQLNT